MVSYVFRRFSEVLGGSLSCELATSVGPGKCRAEPFVTPLRGSLGLRRRKKTSPQVEVDRCRSPKKSKIDFLIPLGDFAVVTPKNESLQQELT